MVAAALCDLNRYMHLATRFTDEIFSTLISVIFIINALGSPTSNVCRLTLYIALHLPTLTSTLRSA